jgi:hypothetical protein
VYSQSNPRATRAIRSAIEAMEPRRLFSVSVTPVDSDGDLVNELLINSDSASDNVLVFDDPQNSKTDVVIDTNDNGVFDVGEVNYQFSQIFEEFEATMNGGNDHFTYYLVSDLTMPWATDLDRAVLVDLGSGSNKFLATSPTSGTTPSGTDVDSDGADIGCDADVNIQVEGGSSTDVITVDFARTTIEGARVNVDINGSYGNDNITVNTPDYNQGEDGIVACKDLASTLQALTVASGIPSAVTVFVETGDGTNTTTFNVASDVEDNSTLDINTRGGANVDTVYANVAVGTFSNSGYSSRSGLDFYADLRGGNDVFKGTYNLQTGQTFLGKNSEVRSMVLGGDGNDNIRYLDTRPAFGDSGDIAGLLDLEGRGNNGDDRVEVDLDTLGGARLTVTSTGEFRAIVHGDSGNDGVFVDAVSGANSTGLFDIAVYGDTGNDKVSLAFKNDGLNTAANYRGGKARLDGGLGTDRWDTEGNVLYNRLSTEILDESLQAPQ